MDLGDFIEIAKEAILAEAVAYARTLPALKGCTELQLRDHLPKVLQAICEDLRASPRRTAIAKSRGQAPGRQRSAIRPDGKQRSPRLSIQKRVAEYRALRCSVLRLWGEACRLNESSLREIGRFNESIDRAVAESVEVFAAGGAHPASSVPRKRATGRSSASRQTPSRKASRPIQRRARK
ncbi:hypothetical protein [Variovorax sp. HW608]|uniref:hypothetical protein n=1 Tax=Variovorax sp. HW608 TaxID=1034889 RepID=UPI0012FDD97F|nr:hypothetical protein [Variovorax sp. HW608]